MAAYTDEEIGNAMPVFIINPDDISGGGSGDGATLAEQETQTTLLTAIDGHVDGLETALVGVSTSAKQDTQSVLIGAVTETAPSSDIDSSGLNGRLQRVAQRLTSLIALLPSSIGAKVSANSLSVTLATNEPALPLPAGASTAANQATIIGHVDGLETLITATNAKLDTVITHVDGLETLLGAATPAGENVIGKVGGSTLFVVSSPTVSTSPAYTAGDSIGGKLTLASALRVSGGSAFLQSVMISDRANQKPTGTLILWHTDPSAATLTDNAAVVLSSTDQNIVAMVPVASADYVTINSKAFANVYSGKALKAVTGTSLYAAFVVTSTPTFAATTDVQIIFGFIQD